jgi:hypothetical protein
MALAARLTSVPVLSPSLLASYVRDFPSLRQAHAVINNEPSHTGAALPDIDYEAVLAKLEAPRRGVRCPWGKDCSQAGSLVYATSAGALRRQRVVRRPATVAGSSQRASSRSSRQLGSRGSDGGDSCDGSDGGDGGDGSRWQLRGRSSGGGGGGDGSRCSSARDLASVAAGPLAAVGAARQQQPQPEQRPLSRQASTRSRSQRHRSRSARSAASVPRAAITMRNAYYQREWPCSHYPRPTGGILSTAFAKYDAPQPDSKATFSEYTEATGAWPAYPGGGSRQGAVVHSANECSRGHQGGK